MEKITSTSTVGFQLENTYSFPIVFFFICRNKWLFMLHIWSSEFWMLTDSKCEKNEVWLLWQGFTERKQCVLSGQENWWLHLSVGCIPAVLKYVTLLLGTVEHWWLKLKKSMDSPSEAAIFEFHLFDSFQIHCSEFSWLLLSLLPYMPAVSPEKTFLLQF